MVLFLFGRNNRKKLKKFQFLLMFFINFYFHINAWCIIFFRCIFLRKMWYDFKSYLKKIMWEKRLWFLIFCPSMYLFLNHYFIIEKISKFKYSTVSVFVPFLWPSRRRSVPVPSQWRDSRVTKMERYLSVTIRSSEAFLE